MKTIPKAPDILRLDCQHCQHVLAAPSLAAGREVKCPSCMQTVTVPGNATTLEDEASNWIEQDLEEMWEEQDMLQAIAPPRKREPVRAPVTRPAKARPESPVAEAEPPVPQRRPMANAIRSGAARCHSRLVPIFN